MFWFSIKFKMGHCNLISQLNAQICFSSPTKIIISIPNLIRKFSGPISSFNTHYHEKSHIPKTLINPKHTGHIYNFLPACRKNMQSSSHPHCTCHVWTYSFAFQEGHPVNLAFKLFSKLFFDGFPSITYIMHLLRALQLYSGVTLQKQVKCLLGMTNVFILLLLFNVLNISPDLHSW